MRREQLLIPLIRQVVKRPRLAEQLFRFDPWGNPFADEALADPMILAPAIRKSPPVHWHPLYQQWFVTGYDEAREVLGSPSVGTAHQMEVLLDVRPYTQLDDETRRFLGNLLLVTDPPDHTRVRALVSRAFTPRQVSRLEAKMEELVDSLLAGFGPRVELMEEFAVPFPAMVIAELLGFDHSDWRWLRRVSAELVKITDPVRAFDPEAIDAAYFELAGRVRALAAERRRQPTDDLMTGLALAEADGDSLSEEELIATTGLILFAGHETTSNMMGVSLIHLRDRPEQIALLKARPDLWPNAVEELLRFDPTLRSDPRTALEDFELAGAKISKGQNIIVMTQLANRDLRRLPDGDELKVDRHDPSPLTFGHGIHYCLGASLARQELRIAMPRLLDATAEYDIDHNNITWCESLSLRGPRILPLVRRG